VASRPPLGAEAWLRSPARWGLSPEPVPDEQFDVRSQRVVGVYRDPSRALRPAAGSSPSALGSWSPTGRGPERSESSRSPSLSTAVESSSLSGGWRSTDGQSSRRPYAEWSILDEEWPAIPDPLVAEGDVVSHSWCRPRGQHGRLRGLASPDGGVSTPAAPARMSLPGFRWGAVVWR
jgi:hypothetical protein